MFILAPFYSLSQPKETTLQGYIGVEGSELYNYKLVFTDSAGSIKGYSATYVKEGEDTRSAIAGSIDKVNKTLSFRELSIVYNHGFHSNNTMCLIDALLKYQPDNTQTTHILKGAYKSADASATYCGMGTVTLMNIEALSRLLKLRAPL